MRFHLARIRFLLDDSDEEEDSLDEQIFSLYSWKSGKRFLYRNIRYRKPDREYWRRYLDTTATNESEFKELFRMRRDQFTSLYNIIKDNVGLKEGWKGRKALHPVLQLMIFLFYLGISGDGAKFSLVGSKFHVSKGAARRCYKRVLFAILSMKDQVIQWPDAEEREEISRRFYVDYCFQDCVGVIDGTYIVLTHKPSWCGEDFYTRKSNYSVQALIICDDRSRILYSYTGWPGSCHDQRVWSNTPIYENPENYFSDSQYLLSDSAFTPSDYIVPSFKCAPGLPLSANQEFFNNKVAKARIKIEHTNGLLKSRFPILKSLNICIKRDRDVVHAIRIFTACCVIHNLILEATVLEPELYAQLLAIAESNDDSPMN